MPITYYTEEEFLKLKNTLEQHINQLCYEVRTLSNEKCNQAIPHTICCSSCQFHHYSGGIKCTSSKKYLSK